MLTWHWSWRFSPTDLDFVKVSVTHIHSYPYRIGFEAGGDEAVSLVSLSRCRSSSWGNERDTCTSVTSVRTRCFPEASHLTKMWFQCLKRRYIPCLQHGFWMQANHFVWCSVESTAILSNTGREIGSVGLGKRWCSMSSSTACLPQAFSPSAIFQIVLMIFNFRLSS